MHTCCGKDSIAIICPPQHNNAVNHKEITMTLHIELIPILSVIAGILILMIPKLLNYVVAIYLIVIGVIQIFGLQI